MTYKEYYENNKHSLSSMDMFSLGEKVWVAAWKECYAKNKFKKENRTPEQQRYVDDLLKSKD